ncbi:MAG: hypothetical protein LLG44_06555 [Chloroflexi bacterium]|nr:hypothetical protein [Chloroflexota bacterium]
MKRGITVAVALVLCLALPVTALADAGPKPSMRINLLRAGQPVDGSAFEFRLLVCAADASTNADPQNTLPGLELLDLSDPSGCTWQVPAYPIWFSNEVDAVSVNGYLPATFRVAIYSQANDALWLSNSAEREGMYTSFTLNLLADGSALLEPMQGNIFQKSWKIEAIIAALLLSLLLETALALGYALWQKRPRRSFILTAVIGNIITLPIVWLLAGFGYMFGGPSAGLVLLAVGEVCAVFLEALLYKLVAKERFGWALLLSLVANTVSYTVGLLLH